MLAGMVDVGGLLVGARQSEFRRSVERIDFQRVLECFDRLRKLLGLHVGRTQKIPGIGVIGIDFDDALECFDRSLRVARILGQQSEAVPGVRAFRILLEGIFQRGFCLVNLLQIQIGDALVQACNRELGIGFGCLLELLQSLFEKLLIHVGDADVVEARGFNWIRLRREGKQTKGRDERGDETCRTFRIHSVKDLTTEERGEHRDFLEFTDHFE